MLLFSAPRHPRALAGRSGGFLAIFALVHMAPETPDTLSLLIDTLALPETRCAA
jgi:hypothetical protein